MFFLRFREPTEEIIQITHAVSVSGEKAPVLTGVTWEQAQVSDYIAKIKVNSNWVQNSAFLLICYVTSDSLLTSLSLTFQKSTEQE